MHHGHQPSHVSYCSPQDCPATPALGAVRRLRFVRCSVAPSFVSSRLSVFPSSTTYAPLSVAGPYSHLRSSTRSSLAFHCVSDCASTAFRRQLRSHSVYSPSPNITHPLRRLTVLPRSQRNSFWHGLERSFVPSVSSAHMRTGCAGYHHYPIAAAAHRNSRSVPFPCPVEPGLTVPLVEYVLQLRQHLRQGVPAHTEEAQSQYIDLVGHWQEQCLKAQEENEKLRSVNIKLERSLQKLTHRTTLAFDDGRPSTASGSFASRQKTVVSPTRRKPPAAKSAERSAAETQEGLESDYDFLEGLGDGKLSSLA